MEYLPLQKCISGIDIKDLSDIELISIIIGTGTKSNNVFNLSMELYRNYNGLPGIYNSGIREISKIKGIGLKKAIKIISSLELGKRLISIEENNFILDSPVKVWKRSLSKIVSLKQEEFYVYVLDSKNSLLKEYIATRGTLNETIVHPREIYKEAIKESASSIIVSHNHPSGDTTPSQNDIRITKRIYEAGKILGIELLDHVIVSEKSYYSFKESGEYSY